MVKNKIFMKLKDKETGKISKEIIGTLDLFIYENQKGEVMKIPQIKNKEFLKEYPFMLLYKDKRTGMLESYSKNDFIAKIKRTGGKQKYVQ